MLKLPTSAKIIDYKEFIHYFNVFHGPAGLYTTKRWASNDDIIAAIKLIENFEGDSIDREKVRDLVFSPIEVTQMYAR